MSLFLRRAILAGNFEPVPEGPVLLCPYVMSNNTMSNYTFVDGVVQGDDGSTLLDTLSIAPNNGKIAIECELVSGTGVSATVSNGTDSAVMTADGSGTSATSGALSTTDSVAASNGDRVGIIIDTDTGAVDYVNEQWHENFAEAVQVDVSGGAGFVLSGTGTVKAYTKTSDMHLPYPAGTTDSCLNGGLRELVAYPLDASEAEIQGLGIAERLSMSLAEQRGEFATNATTGSFYEAFAMPAGISTETADPLDLTTGAVAFEFDYSLPSHDSGGAGSSIVLRNDFRLMDPAFSNWLELRFMLQDDGTYLRNMEVGGQNVTPAAASASSKVGILIDNANGELRVWFDGVELEVIGVPIPWTNPPPAALLALMNVTQTNNWDGTVGLTAQNRFITDPYWFTTPFPAGSRDINGNVFN